ncbi:MAG: hypothetical protein A2091_12655 [Desulfuromonadales bacterium GWD2_61_12]|nr:MAG: hypothetical protein A2005_11380 [Desulfuromonadales bacterium GWC2_61_20]OGR36534.1 MAG: hypothetical protein A2091_12655 [Desulfuromonadales bacterium GWD2_61_12]HAD05074.1 hypothetical protein [Desulfuromonas sp.]HBT83975.1 hypothetical protein [Desulfuromonas sp.]
MKTHLLLPLLGILLLLPLRARAADTVLAETVPLPLAEDAGTQVVTYLDWTDPGGDFLGGRTGYIHPFVAVGERFTDNYFNSTADPQSEYTTIITPGLWLVAPPSRQQPLRVNTMIATPGGLEIARFRTETATRFQGYALYRANFEMNARFPEEERTSHHGEAFILYQSPRGLSLEILEVYEEEQDPFYGDTNQTYNLERYKANLIHTLLNVPITARTGLRADYANYRLDFDAQDNAYRKREDNALSVRLSRKSFAKSELFLLYEQVLIDYDLALLLDSTEYHAFAGIEWRASAKMRGRVMLGYGQKDFWDKGRVDYGEPIGEVRLDYRFAAKRSAYLQATRKINEPDTPSTSGTLATQTSFGFRQKLLTRLEVTIDGSYLFEEYREKTVAGGMVGMREDSYYRAGLALGYTPRKWLDVTIGYRFLRRDSNFPALCYDNNTAYLRLSAAL